VASFLPAAMAFAGGRFDAGLGVLAGAALGLVPVLSWAWAIAPLMRGSGRSGWLVAALMLGKVILYGGALYLLIWSRRVHVPSMAMALLIPHAALAIAAMARPAATEAKA